MGGRGASYNSYADKQDFINNLMGKNNQAPRKEIDIVKYQGMKMSEIESMIRPKHHEEIFAFEGDKIIGAAKGGPHSVGIPSAALKPGLDVTHNHPSGAGAARFGGTLSFADVKSMLQLKWHSIRAAAAGQGEFNYIMKNNGMGRGNKFYQQMNHDYLRLRNSIDKKYGEVYDKVIKSGESRTSALHRARQESVGVLNRYYKDTAPKYGFSYVSKKESYLY